MFLRFWKSNLDIRNSRHKSMLVGADELCSGYKSSAGTRGAASSTADPPTGTAPQHMPHHQAHPCPLPAAQLPPTQAVVQLSACFLQQSRKENLPVYFHS